MGRDAVQISIDLMSGLVLRSVAYHSRIIAVRQPFGRLRFEVNRATQRKRRFLWTRKLLHPSMESVQYLL